MTEEYIKRIEEFCLENKISIDKSGYEKILALGEDYLRLLHFHLIKFYESGRIDEGLIIGEKQIAVYVEKEQENEYGENSSLELKVEDILINLKKDFEELKKILKKYIDTSEENYEIITLWIIGTYIHDTFCSFPYLFFNAMKASGKSRTIKLIICLSRNGRLVMDLTDAVLFRTAYGSTLGIDEFENVIAKEKNTLRTLLNSAYKKGVKVARMAKIKNKGNEELKVEEFEVYAPIVMANINGMDDVLSDRCITIIQERSTNERINRLIENFEDDLEIQTLKLKLVKLVKLVQLMSFKDIISEWNEYVQLMTLEITPITQTTLTTSNKSLFEKIYQSDIKGRHLELFFPLFLIASLLDEETLNRTIENAKKIVSTKKNDDLTESRDVALIEFVSKKPASLSFVKINELTREFKESIQEEDEQYQNINSKWVGRALKRLNLIIDKKRLSKGIEVILNVAKAQEKIKLFKIKEDTNNTLNN